MKYVLVTPARNEEAFVEKTLQSVVKQTVLPLRWVIVDDGSTDRTAEIVKEYAQQFSWIELLQRPRRADRNFAGKAYSFDAGFRRLESFDFDLIGCLDADVSFDADYFEFLIKKFRENQHLGVAGTAMHEPHFHALKDSFYSDQDVAGNCQVFRLACLRDIGGYVPSKLGGVDWIAVRTARLKGWQTRAFPDKLFFHHRAMGTAEGGILKARFDYGRKDYFLGNHPLWQVFRIAYQMCKWPYVIGGLALLSGYLYGLAMRIERPVTPELIRFHRREQMSRLRRRFLGFPESRRAKARS
jgi:glycosyltransferase involved in cell wall biosynthesis